MKKDKAVYLPTVDGQPARWMDNMLYPAGDKDFPAVATSNKRLVDDWCKKSRAYVRAKGLCYCDFRGIKVTLIGGE